MPLNAINVAEQYRRTEELTQVIEGMVVKGYV